MSLPSRLCWIHLWLCIPRMEQRLWDCHHALNVSRESWASAGSWLWWQRSPPAPQQHLGCQTPRFPHPVYNLQTATLANIVLMFPHPSAQRQTLPWQPKKPSLFRGKPLQGGAEPGLEPGSTGVSPAPLSVPSHRCQLREEWELRDVCSCTTSAGSRTRVPTCRTSSSCCAKVILGFARLAGAALPAVLAPGAGWGFVSVSWPNSVRLPSFLIRFINCQIQQAEPRAPSCDKNKITA